MHIQRNTRLSELEVKNKVHSVVPKHINSDKKFKVSTVAQSLDNAIRELDEAIEELNRTISELTNHEDISN